MLIHQKRWLYTGLAFTRKDLPILMIFIENLLENIKLKIKGKLFMKFDVEGTEMEILKGAVETIKKYKSNLAICVYHYIDDIWKIPEYLKFLVPEYKFVLRGGAHLVCYASVMRRF